MAKMDGTNANYYTKLKPQGGGRMTPKRFERNNMSMGGCNDQMQGIGDTDGGDTGRSMAGKTGMGVGYKTKLGK